MYIVFKLKMCLECCMKKLYGKNIFLKNYLYILARDVFLLKKCFHMYNL